MQKKSWAIIVDRYCCLQLVFMCLLRWYEGRLVLFKGPEMKKQDQVWGSPLGWFCCCCCFDPLGLKLGLPNYKALLWNI